MFGKLLVQKWSFIYFLLYLNMSIMWAEESSYNYYLLLWNFNSISESFENYTICYYMM